MATIGEQIRAARKAKGMTQDDLASALNVTRSGISKWETNSRVPDAEMLLRLSETLNYQFALSTEEHASEENEENEVNEASEKKEEKPEGAAPSGTASAEGRRAEDSPKPASPKARFIRYLPFCAAALALVILAVVLIVANQPKKAAVFADGNGNEMTVEEFRTATPNDPSKAYLGFQTSLRFTGEGLDKHVFYTFDMSEENGIAVHIDRIDHVIFSVNGKYTQDVLRAEDLIDPENNPDIKPNGTFSLMGGTDYYTSEGKPDSLGVGLKVYCTDAGNNQLVFRSFVDFPQE